MSTTPGETEAEEIEETQNEGAGITSGLLMTLFNAARRVFGGARLPKQEE